MTAEREAKIKVTAEGHDQVAQQEQKLADVQRDVAEAATEKGQALEQSAASAEAAEQSTGKLGDSVGGLKDVLTKINPAFGEMIDAMGAAFNVAGELGESEIRLGQIIGKVKESVVENASAYKLLVAGGGAVAALALLASSWRNVREEIQATLDLQRQFVDEQNKLRGEKEEVRKAIVDEFAQRGKGPGDLHEAERIAERLASFGFDANAVPVASTLAGEGASFKQAAAFAAAAESGLVDPNAANPLEQLQNALSNPANERQIQDALNLRIGEERRRRETSARQADAFGVDRGYTGSLFRFFDSQWLLKDSFLADWTDADPTRSGPTDEFVSSIGSQFGTDEAESARLADQYQKWRGNVEADRGGTSRPFQAVQGNDLTRIEQIDAALRRSAPDPFDVSELGRGGQAMDQTNQANGKVEVHHHEHKTVNNNTRNYGKENLREHTAAARVRGSGRG